MHVPAYIVDAAFYNVSVYCDPVWGYRALQRFPFRIG